MNTNLNALLRSHIPLEMQGRVFAARNTLQFSPSRWDIFWEACWSTVCSSP